MQKDNVDCAERTQGATRLRLSPRTKQCLNRCAKCRKFKWLFDELKAAKKSTLGSDFRRERGADHERARFRVRISKLVQAICDSGPRRIDIENEKLRVELCGKFSEFLNRARNDADVLRREFLQRRADGSPQRIILLEQDDVWLRHICISGFRTSRHLGKPSKFLQYDKAGALVKGKQVQFVYRCSADCW